MSTMTHDNQQADAGTDSISLDEAIEFIWREGEMLDRQDYDAWLPLWTETGMYVIPIDHDRNADHLDQLNVLYDNAEMREARIKRLRSGFSISSAPSARTVRTLSRFVMGESDENGVEIRGAQHLVEYKFERTRMLAGDVTYRLVKRDGRIMIDRKEVLLINSDDALWGIGYLI